MGRVVVGNNLYNEDVDAQLPPNLGVEALRAGPAILKQQEAREPARKVVTLFDF